MSGPGVFDEPEGATPLSPEEREGLIPSHVTMRHELNELEQQNILKAATWVLTRKPDPIDEIFVRGLHKRMFGDVWKWAGEYRQTNKNIGVDKTVIHMRLAEILSNFRYWLENKTFSPDEIGVRFHHDLVLIHPFPNGNGRWSRMMADILMVKMEQPRLTWGHSLLIDADEIRARYMDALHRADAHDYAPLIAFAKT